MTNFFHTQAAYSVTGKWLYVVNIAHREEFQQGIIIEECL